jgi:hypothetical protein
MSIHAPAHQPHFHWTVPHLGDAATGILSAVAALVLVVLLAIGASLLLTQSTSTGADPLSGLAAFRASERAESALAPSIGAGADPLSGLAAFRASERAESAPSDLQTRIQFLLEEHGY